MGFTYEQAKQLGIGHLHPAVAGGRSKEAELLDSVYASEKPASKAPQDGLNKMARRFRDTVLEPAWVRGDIGDYRGEAVNLRLAGRTWYRPDWMVTTTAGEHGLSSIYTFIELKGFMRDDAAVKLKVAASMYPIFRWWLITRDKWGWEVRVVDRGGIGRSPIVVPWIHGEGI